MLLLITSAISILETRGPPFAEPCKGFVNCFLRDPLVYLPVDAGRQHSRHAQEPDNLTIQKIDRFRNLELISTTTGLG